MTRYVIASILLASGCLFRVNPDFDPPAPDLGPPDDSSPAPSATPDDLGPALAPSAPDLSPSCTRVTEPFAADPSASWTMMGDAAFDESRGELQLTSLGFDVAGSAFFDAALPSGAFDARFSFRMGDGSGADGLAFVLANAGSAGTLTPFGNGALNQGYGLGYLGMDGFAVEFDSFMDIGNGDPNANHVALVRTSDGTHLLIGAPSGSLHSAASHTAHIRFAGNHLTVEVDGARALDSDLPGDLTWPTGPLFFGFTGASSTFNDRHAVSALSLIIGPAGTCF